MPNLFFALRVIDFESEICTYYDVKKDLRRINPRVDDLVLHQEINKVYNSKLYKLWRIIWKISPNYYFWDWFLTKYFRNGFNLFGVKFCGYNAMMWAIQWQWGDYYWLFRPPCFLVLGGRGWTWGRLYKSPNGTPRHPDAVHYYY